MKEHYFHKFRVFNFRWGRSLEVFLVWLFPHYTVYLSLTDQDLLQQKLDSTFVNSKQLSRTT